MFEWLECLDPSKILEVLIVFFMCVGGESHKPLNPPMSRVLFCMMFKIPGPSPKGVETGH